MEDDWARVVVKIARLWNAGVNARSIAAALRHDAVPVPQGHRRWTAAVVARVLTHALH